MILVNRFTFFVERSWKNMYFHPKLAWPHATYDVISRNHSNCTKLVSKSARGMNEQLLKTSGAGVLSPRQKLRKTLWGRGEVASTTPHPLYVRGFIQELGFRIPMQWEPRIPDSTLFLERWVIFMNLIVIKTDRFAFGVESSSMLWIKRLILHGASMLESSGWSFDSIDDVLNLEKLSMFSPNFEIFSKPLKPRKPLIALRMCGWWLQMKGSLSMFSMCNVCSAECPAINLSCTLMTFVDVGRGYEFTEERIVFKINQNPCPRPFLQSALIKFSQLRFLSVCFYQSFWSKSFWQNPETLECGHIPLPPQTQHPKTERCCR